MAWGSKLIGILGIIFSGLIFGTGVLLYAYGHRVLNQRKNMSTFFERPLTYAPKQNVEVVFDEYPAGYYDFAIHYTLDQKNLPPDLIGG